MKKQISLLLVAIALNLSNGVQASSLSKTVSHTGKSTTTALGCITRSGGLSQDAIKSAIKFSSQQPKTLRMPAVNSYSQFLPKHSKTIMPIRAFAPSTASFDQQKTKSNDSDWQEFNCATNARLISSLLASGIFITGSVLAEQEDVTKDVIVVTPLMYATVKDRRDEVKELIKAGVNVDTKDNEGRTALMYAAVKDRRNVTKELIKAGADVNAKDNKGQTALMFAAAKDMRDIAKELIKANADVNAKDNQGQTALMFAAAKDRRDVAKELIKAGADVNVKDNKGQTALMYAAAQKNREMIKELILAGASIHPLVCSDIVEAVIKAKADIDARNRAESTASMPTTAEDKLDAIIKIVKNPLN